VNPPNPLPQQLMASIKLKINRRAGAGFL